MKNQNNSPAYDAMKHLATMILVSRGETRSQEQIDLAALSALVNLNRGLIPKEHEHTPQPRKES